MIATIPDFLILLLYSKRGLVNLMPTIHVPTYETKDPMG